MKTANGLSLLSPPLLLKGMQGVGTPWAALRLHSGRMGRVGAQVGTGVRMPPRQPGGGHLSLSAWLLLILSQAFPHERGTWSTQMWMVERGERVTASKSYAENVEKSLQSRGPLRLPPSWSREGTLAHPGE